MVGEVWSITNCLNELVGGVEVSDEVRDSECGWSSFTS